MNKIVVYKGYDLAFNTFQPVWHGAGQKKEESNPVVGNNKKQQEKPSSAEGPYT